MLDENYKLVRDKKRVSNNFNDFFVNVVPNLGIKTKYDSLNTATIYHFENAIYKYDNHPIAIAIQNMKGTNSSFSFQAVTKRKHCETYKEIR